MDSVPHVGHWRHGTSLEFTLKRNDTTEAPTTEPVAEGTYVPPTLEPVIVVLPEKTYVNDLKLAIKDVHVPREAALLDHISRLQAELDDSQRRHDTVTRDAIEARRIAAHQEVYRKDMMGNISALGVRLQLLFQVGAQITRLTGLELLMQKPQLQNGALDEVKFNGGGWSFILDFERGVLTVSSKKFRGQTNEFRLQPDGIVKNELLALKTFLAYVLRPDQAAEQLPEAVFGQVVSTKLDSSSPFDGMTGLDDAIKEALLHEMFDNREGFSAQTGNADRIRELIRHLL